MRYLLVLLALMVSGLGVQGQVAYFAGVTGRAEVPDCKLHAAQEVYVMIGEDITREWKCISYAVVTMLNDEAVKIENKGATLEPTLKGFLSTLKAGDFIGIEDIRLQGPDNEIKKQKEIIIQITKCTAPD